MASSETELPEQLSALFDRLLRHRDLSMFLPFVLGFNHGQNQDSPDEETPQGSSPSDQTRERIILVNPFTQGMVVIEGGASSLETLFRELANGKGEHPPASRASIEAMESVEVGEGEVEEGECCVVCLEDWEVGEVAKVMPCNHRFHSKCIEKWLGLHGSCPVCRYKMPVEEEEEGKKRDDDEEEEEDGEGRRRGSGREIWVSFSFNGGRRSGGGDQGQDQVTAATPGSDDTSSSPATGSEMEG